MLKKFLMLFVVLLVVWLIGYKIYLYNASSSYPISICKDGSLPENAIITPEREALLSEIVLKMRADGLSKYEQKDTQNRFKCTYSNSTTTVALYGEGLKIFFPEYADIDGYELGQKVTYKLFPFIDDDVVLATAKASSKDEYEVKEYFRNKNFKLKSDYKNHEETLNNASEQYLFTSLLILIGIGGLIIVFAFIRVIIKGYIKLDKWLSK